MTRRIRRRDALKFALAAPVIAAVGSQAGPAVRQAFADPTDAIDVESFRDGVRTDDEILAAAFDALSAGGRISFGEGVTYSLATTLSPVLTNKPDVVIDGRGATVFMSNPFGVIFKPRGTKFSAAARPTLTEAVTKHATTIKVSSVGDIRPGDLIQIFSDSQLFSRSGGGASGSTVQEMARVAAVVGNTTLVLDNATWNDYSIHDHVVSVISYRPVRNLTIKDLTVAGNGGMGDGSGNRGLIGLQPAYFDGLTLANVNALNVSENGINALEGLNLTATGCRAVGCAMDNIGYGFHANTVHGATFVGCSGARNRHSFDAHNTRDLLIQGCTADDDRSAGISTHGADIAKIADCTVRDCGGGIIVRGTNSTVVGNHIQGSKRSVDDDQTYFHGIRVGTWFGDDPQVHAVAGANLVIEDNFIDIGGPAYTPTDAGNGIRIEEPLMNARIAGNTVKGFPQQGIFIRGDTNTDVDIVDNQIDCTGQRSSGTTFAVQMQSQNTAARCVNIDINISGNTVVGAGVVLIAGGSTTTPVSDDIHVRGNTVDAIRLDRGYYGPNVEAHANRTARGEDTAAVIAR